MYRYDDNDEHGHVGMRAWFQVNNVLLDQLLEMFWIIKRLRAPLSGDNMNYTELAPVIVLPCILVLKRWIIQAHWLLQIWCWWCQTLWEVELSSGTTVYIIFIYFELLLFLHCTVYKEVIRGRTYCSYCCFMQWLRFTIVSPSIFVTHKNWIYSTTIDWLLNINESVTSIKHEHEL